MRLCKCGHEMIVIFGTTQMSICWCRGCGRALQYDAAPRTEEEATDKHRWYEPGTIGQDMREPVTEEGQEGGEPETEEIVL